MKSAPKFTEGKYWINKPHSNPLRSPGHGMERWPEFNSEHPHGSLQLSVTAVPGDPTSSHRYTCRQNTKAQKKKMKKKKKLCQWLDIFKVKFNLLSWKFHLCSYIVNTWYRQKNDNSDYGILTESFQGSSGSILLCNWEKWSQELSKWLTTASRGWRLAWLPCLCPLTGQHVLVQ